MKQHLINLDRPLLKGEVRHGLLSKGEGALVFDETEAEPWTLRRQKSYTLRRFRHGTLRRMENGQLRIRLTFDVPREVFDCIDLGLELGNIADYVCRYQERRRP